MIKLQHYLKKRSHPNKSSPFFEKAESEKKSKNHQKSKAQTFMQSLLDSIKRRVGSIISRPPFLFIQSHEEEEQRLPRWCFWTREHVKEVSKRGFPTNACGLFLWCALKRILASCLLHISNVFKNCILLLHTYWCIDVYLQYVLQNIG